MRHVLWWGVTLVLAAGVARAEGRRFLVVVSANVGLPEDSPLRYAERDARRMVEVMRHLGGVETDRVLTVSDATAGALRRALKGVEARLRAEAWGAGDELFVYVSSHAADGHLHLNGTRFPIRELRAFIDEAPVGVAVLVFDACQAGMLARPKGLVPLKGAVDINRPLLEGRAVIASSGEDQSSHESDSLRGSYFTYNLVMGLRGIADTSGDGRITLQEAYRYARDRTMLDTMGVVGEPQTPQYYVDLHGDGDLVLTEVERAPGQLALAVPQAGEWSVASLADDRPIQRFHKRRGEVLFALEPGAYRLTTSLDDRMLLEAEVEVASGATAIVTPADLRPRPVSTLRAKRGAGARWALGAGGAAGSAAIDGISPVLLGGSVWGRAETAVAGFATYGEVALGARLPATKPDGFGHREIDLALGVGLRQTGFGLGFRQGVRLGGVLAVQDGLPDGSRLALLPRAAVVVGTSVPLWGGTALGLSAEAGLQRARAEGEDELVRPYGVLALGAEHSL